MRTILICIALVTLTSCDSLKKPLAAIIDCSQADQAQLGQLSLELVPLLAGEHVDWSAIGERAKEAGATIGGCVLAELVQSYLGGNRAVSVMQSHAARDALEHFRTTVAGGATFRTPQGDL